MNDYVLGAYGNAVYTVQGSWRSGTTEADIYNEADSGLANSALSGSYFLFSGTYVTT